MKKDKISSFEYAMREILHGEEETAKEFECRTPAEETEHRRSVIRRQLDQLYTVDPNTGERKKIT